MKKPSVVSFLITLLLALSVCTQGKELVKDSDGNSLELRQQYFIQPVKTDANKKGGLVPVAIKFPDFCPLAISQSLISSQPGLPVIFEYPFLTPETFINTSTDVNIVFQSDIWVCPQFSKSWVVDNSSSAAEPNILIAGVRGNQNSSFTIEKAGEGAGVNTYKVTSLDGTVGVIKGGIWGTQLVGMS